MLRLMVVVALLVAAPALADEDTLPRTLSVTGRGEVTAPPDMARVSLGVTTEGNTAGQALDRNSKAMAAVFKALRDAGIAERDIRTTNVSLSPLWSHPQAGDERPKIRGYSASNTVQVTARDFAALGGLLDRATSAGATDIGGIWFDVSDREARLDAARKAAAEDARRKAEIYASAIGVKLGPVISLAEGGAVVPMPKFEMRMAMADAAAVPIAGGEETLSAMVSVVFGIE